MPTVKYGFIYIWFDRFRKMYYIGSHWGAEDDGYICSSNRMRDAYRRRPQDFKRRVIERLTSTRQELLEAEFRWLSLIPSEQLGKRYYNLRTHHPGHWSADPYVALTVGRKISKAISGRKLSEEHVAKLKGRKPTEETRAKLSAAGKGRVFVQETRDKIAAGVRKTYRFVSPEGETHVVDNLLDFCAEHDLKYQPMVNLYNGKYYKDTYKGWSALNN